MADRSLRSARWVLPVFLFAAPPAFAHAMLARASPAAGSNLAAPPAAIVITFSEDVEPDFSAIDVTDAAGKRVDKSDPHLVGGNHRQLGVDLRKLPPGTYTVNWHATSVDTHKTSGTFGFTLAP